MKQPKVILNHWVSKVQSTLKSAGERTERAVTEVLDAEEVTVKTQPPSQLCTVSNGKGVLARSYNCLAGLFKKFATRASITPRQAQQFHFSSVTSWSAFNSHRFLPYFPSIFLNLPKLACTEDLL